jgi:ABC-type glycerol-3-phosphate transport system substrate-binding protein
MLMIAIIGAAGNKDWKGNLRLANSILASLLFAALLVTAGCAGLVSSSSPKPAEPAPYVVTVTASAANAPTHSQQFTLNVAP